MSNIQSLMESVNVAESLTKEQLVKIGTDAKEGFQVDSRSRSPWEKCVDEYIALAKQIAETKSWPWPNASNVKYPLLSTAAMQFAARAYPSLVPSDGRVVKARVIGKDPDGTKTEVAEAVSIYMSYQLMEEMEGWEEDMDKLLIMLPIVGVVFKKTYWDPVKEVNCSKLVLPKNLVVNYWAKNLREAERISEILEINPRVVTERKKAKLWLDVELDAPSSAEAAEGRDESPDSDDATTPYIFIEQHTYIDLDDDGYPEPYIVTFQKSSGKVVRIVPRFDQNCITLDDDNKLIKIDAIQYYTKFGFVPNPDGSFYDIGFGVLLGPINEAVNSLINQLVDSGTLSNMQSGFIGKGLRLKMGTTSFSPGEWKVVNSTGDDLKKGLLPLPAREPSKVLFELMGALISSGKELASVAEIFVGKMPGQNTPATTTMATIEQGMKVFTAVYKRIYRSLTEEFHKLYRLNGIYVNPNEYVEVIDMEIGPDIFDNSTHRIFPGADPTAISQTEKLLKAQGLMELMGSGAPLDPVKVIQRVLEAQEQPNWQELLPQQIQQTGQLPPPPPDPKMEEMKMKGQLEQQKMAGQMQMMQHKAELESRTAETQMQMKAQEHQVNLQAKQQQLRLSAAEALHKQRIFEAEAQGKIIQQALEARQGAVHSEQTHQQDLRHSAELNRAKAEAVRTAAKSKGAKKQ